MYRTPIRYESCGATIAIRYSVNGALFSVGIVPVNYIVKRLGNRELVMRYHGLGPHGTRALATALIVSQNFSFFTF